MSTPIAWPESPFHRMRLVATLLLVAMACVFGVATWLSATHPAWPWVQAFAEAAMVGGLADWFAVTALFRHPLGVPIPHTAIIPRNKDRIGDSLAAFLKDNFLTPAVVARRLESVDIAGAAGRWLAAPAVAGTRRRGRGLGPLVARLIEALDHEAIGTMVRDAATAKLRETRLSLVLAGIVEAMVAGDRLEPVIDAGVQWAARTLDSQEGMIRAMVHDRTTWVLRLVSVDDRVADAIVDGLRRMLTEVAGDPEHPLRARIIAALEDFAFDLRHLPETQARVETIKDDLLGSPALGTWLAGLWNSARHALVRAARSPGAGTGERLGEATQAVGRTILADDALRGAINLHLRRAAVGLVGDYGDGIVALVSDTIRGWDAATVTDKLENAVGRDLQYIRINGTVIGGLIGLAIHAVTLAG